MEFLNKVELQGIVGAVREIQVESQKVFRFSVATDYAYRNPEGAVVETTWHNVVAYQPLGESWDWLVKGAMVWVSGRLRTTRFMRSDGSEAYSNEIVAKSIKPVATEE